jgi:hypothetical protein
MLLEEHEDWSRSQVFHAWAFELPAVAVKVRDSC